ncbi:MAG TPA: hypothetical protein PK767_01700 [Clostridiales bacterium]|nr:hypothetical protein [Clostridiales bacterium]
MIRGLFIGFLILSALMPKSAEIQIVNIMNMANLLPDLPDPGTACTDKACGLNRPGGCCTAKDPGAEQSNAGEPRAFAAWEIRKAAAAIRNEILPSGSASSASGQRDIPVVAEPVAIYDSPSLIRYIGQGGNIPVRSGERCFMSGLSPPFEVC